MVAGGKGCVPCTAQSQYLTLNKKESWRSAEHHRQEAFNTSVAACGHRRQINEDSHLHLRHSMENLSSGQQGCKMQQHTCTRRAACTLILRGIQITFHVAEAIMSWGKAEQRSDKLQRYRRCCSCKHCQLHHQPAPARKHLMLDSSILQEGRACV